MCEVHSPAGSRDCSGQGPVTDVATCVLPEASNHCFLAVISLFPFPSPLRSSGGSAHPCIPVLQHRPGQHPELLHSAQRWHSSPFPHPQVLQKEGMQEEKKPQQELGRGLEYLHVLEETWSSHTIWALCLSPLLRCPLPPSWTALCVPACWH